MRAAVIVLLLAIAPSVARAQAYYAFTAVLAPAPAGEPLGVIHGAPIDLLGWDAPRRPRIRYRDGSIAIRSAIALDDPETRVVVGVGRRTALATDTGWSAWLAPGSWAPLRGHGASGVEIAVAAGLPFVAAEMVSASARARGVPEGAFDHTDPAGAGWRSSCEDTEIELRARPSSGAAAWRAPYDAAFRVGRRARGWVALEAWVEGVVIRGYVRRKPQLCPGRLPGLVGIGVLAALQLSFGCSRGDSTLDAVAVPAGTRLYASAAGGPSLARTRRDLVARRIGGSVVELREGGRDRWILRAHLRTPIDALEPAIGIWTSTECRPDPWDWPE